MDKIWLDTFCVAEPNILLYQISFSCCWLGEVIVTKDGTGCYISAKTNQYDWRWTARERFRILLSNEAVACLLGMVWCTLDATVSTLNYFQACWSKKLVLGHIMNILLHSLGQAVSENIHFSDSVWALPTVRPILPALNRIFSCTAFPLIQ